VKNCTDEVSGMKLEKMDEFFTARTEGYDEHMLDHVGGCREGYLKMAEVIPAGTKTILDLGCGTGLELDRIFERFPDAEVTGIDLTKSMLDKLLEKHPDKNLNLICGDYFEEPFGTECFDCVVSFETMHHFKPEKKTELYRKIYDALKPGGCYIECDYMVGTKLEEDYYFSEYERIRTEQGIPEETYCHYDTPCSLDTQNRILSDAGFDSLEEVFRMENTVMLVAYKSVEQGICLELKRQLSCR